MRGLKKIFNVQKNKKMHVNKNAAERQQREETWQQI